MGIDAVGGVSNSIDISGMDLETALMAVQSNRANQLEDQLKSQIQSVQNKNDQISKLNTLLGSLNAAAAKVTGDKATDSAKISSADASAIQTAASAAGATLPSELQGSAGANKGQLDAYVQSVKSQIDSLSNTQQMDMLRLQSLSNKRNEAYDIMTNFVKTMSDKKSAIIGNMR
jgi:hypothetical protein